MSGLPNVTVLKPGTVRFTVDVTPPIRSDMAEVGPWDRHGDPWAGTMVDIELAEFVVQEHGVSYPSSESFGDLDSAVQGWVEMGIGRSSLYAKYASAQGHEFKREWTKKGWGRLESW